MLIPRKLSITTERVMRMRPWMTAAMICCPDWIF